MKIYLTLLSNHRYLDGVIALNESLKDVGSKFPLVCLLSKDADISLERALHSHNIDCVRYTGESLNDNDDSAYQSYNHWAFTFDKLHVWGLTQYEKIVFLDSDMIVVQNIDHLFGKEPFSAAVAGGRLFNWTKLNSGLMVIKPDTAVESDLVKLAPSVIKSFRDKNLSVGDQDVIQAYCPWWESRQELCLDEGYNMVADWIDYYVRRFGYGLSEKKKKPIYVIHFIGHTKPWTPKSNREKYWVIKTSIRNPFFLYYYVKFHRLLRNAKRTASK